MWVAEAEDWATGGLECHTLIFTIPDELFAACCVPEDPSRAPPALLIRIGRPGRRPFMGILAHPDIPRTWAFCPSGTLGLLRCRINGFPRLFRRLDSVGLVLGHTVTPLHTWLTSMRKMKGAMKWTKVEGHNNAIQVAGPIPDRFNRKLHHAYRTNWGGDPDYSSQMLRTHPIKDFRDRRINSVVRRPRGVTRPLSDELNDLEWLETHGTAWGYWRDQDGTICFPHEHPELALEGVRADEDGRQIQGVIEEQVMILADEVEAGEGIIVQAPAVTNNQEIEVQAIALLINDVPRVSEDRVATNNQEIEELSAVLLVDNARVVTEDLTATYDHGLGEQTAALLEEDALVLIEDLTAAEEPVITVLQDPLASDNDDPNADPNANRKTTNEDVADYEVPAPPPPQQHWPFRTDDISDAPDSEDGTRSPSPVREFEELSTEPYPLTGPSNHKGKRIKIKKRPFGEVSTLSMEHSAETSIDGDEPSTSQGRTRRKTHGNVRRRAKSRADTSGYRTEEPSFMDVVSSSQLHPDPEGKTAKEAEESVVLAEGCLATPATSTLGMESAIRDHDEVRRQFDDLETLSSWDGEGNAFLEGPSAGKTGLVGPEEEADNGVVNISWEDFQVVSSWDEGDAEESDRASTDPTDVNKASAVEKPEDCDELRTPGTTLADRETPDDTTLRLHPNPPPRGEFIGSEADYDAYLETLTLRYYKTIAMTGFFVVTRNRLRTGLPLPFVLHTAVPGLELIDDELVEATQLRISFQATEAFLRFYGQEISALVLGVDQRRPASEEQRAYACGEATMRFVSENPPQGP